MEEIGELRRRLMEERPVDWEGLPDIGLYMDQLISYMPRQLIHYDEAETLTPAMVNNYIKDGLLPRAEGKRYSRTHLSYLTAICALKQVLSVKDVGRLMGLFGGGQEPQEMYRFFQQELDGALGDTAGSLSEDVGEDALAELGLSLALRAYADRLACQRILDILEGREEGPSGTEKGKKEK